MDKIQMWVNDMLNKLENMEDKEAGISLMEGCGRDCARAGVVSRIQEFKEKNRDIRDPYALINEISKDWTKIKVEDGKIYLVYDQCLCPMMKMEIKKSPFFCNCSVGWVKEAFATLIGMPVEVEMEKSINQGDDLCRFSIRFDACNGGSKVEL